MPATIYLIPTVLHHEQTDCLPAYLLPAIQQCSHLFVEQERTARRYLKLLSKALVIDDFRWYNMREITPDVAQAFQQAMAQDAVIGIISEAGCPGIADPGQVLVAMAQAAGAVVKPLVGPNSILLALMASGMNGQRFQFVGYLPIDAAARMQAIKALEHESKQKDCTQIFIETPYRNNQLLETLVKTCNPATRICVAADLTAPTEYIRTLPVKSWRGQLPELHKRPAIFLMEAANS